jgi:hypothetical protein
VRFRRNPRRAFEFGLAERLGKTHAELETGVAQPISGSEVTEWMALDEMRGELRAQSQNRAAKQQQAEARRQAVMGR